jgi:hypothetical protein
MKILPLMLLICGGTILHLNPLLIRTANPTPQSTTNLLGRHYQVGEKLSYHMKGINQNWQYEIQADGIVKKDAAGAFFEEYAWSNMISAGQPFALPATSADFRQTLSLGPEHPPAIPDFSKVHPMLIGPMADLLTFYSDLWLVNRAANFSHEGDHFYVKNGAPSSWADGSRVLVGEDSIDFDITLKSISQSDQTAVVLVRHVPPAQPQVKIPAEWMRAPVADTPNNWVQVQKNADGKFVGEVGKETFDVEIKVSLTNGKMLSAKMDNPVEVLKRECTDAALTVCGPAARYKILRQIEIH